MYKICILYILFKMTNSISATQARTNLQEIINRVEYGRERIVIERHGKAVVVIIGL
ncbi:hypothetical protein FIS3754_48660 [Fischerella sp. NIES-3754]|nr:hypothetical protein FIS3754_48660 [Fischerella sp. NIES-3754]BCX06385.1 MAG: hypothetical protein KatS3mg066_0244 [Fischerella sp.]